MRNMLAFVAAAVLVFLGLGWYLDWYSFKNLPTGTAGHQSFTIDINKAKITSDVEKGEEKIHEAIDKKKVEASAGRQRCRRVAAENGTARRQEGQGRIAQHRHDPSQP